MPDKRKRRPPAQPVDPRALIARLNQESQKLLEREIIAPLLPGGRIRTRMSGLIYEFKSSSRFVGWGRFRPLNEREAEPLGEAQPWERAGYLELFPVLRVVLLWPDNSGRYPGTWLALPYNESDAHQRFGLSMEPLPVFLCDPTAGAERFERVLTRVDGHTLWFEGVDVLADPIHAERLRIAADQENNEEILSGLAASERQALLFWRLRQLEISLAESTRLTAQARTQNRQEQQDRVSQQVRQLGVEGQLQHALAKADATLHSYSEITAPDGSVCQLKVEWSERGQTRHYHSYIDPRLTVVSSGICLSDLDSEFDLTSLVSVISAAPGEWNEYDEE